MHSLYWVIMFCFQSSLPGLQIEYFQIASRLLAGFLLFGVFILGVFLLIASFLCNFLSWNQMWDLFGLLSPTAIWSLILFWLLLQSALQLISFELIPMHYSGPKPKWQLFIISEVSCSRMQSFIAYNSLTSTSCPEAAVIQSVYVQWKSHAIANS